ncbi:dual specificity protein phosphatase 12 [Protobothrops mucrosquamatus]|uniref:dual specificity protein phosphatase 12 n=1 Tax=Protobothrops mucrosquamatus TaxID=103944 RepID=UPI000775F07B|nr:dual specificity protein phosphatase 12 [Protobothrops mucrosquamatus]XP_015669527.1 dual specificity protein phosphatase 12 [Protobothrops mucrosquamatus]
MVPVLPQLYLSGADLASADGSGKPAVTALLQVDSEPAGAAALAGFESTLFVQALDCPQSDLLSRLDDCVAFLSQVLEGGGSALVRCHAGVSRSVAIVTAYLMKTNHLTFQEAYAFVQAIKPDAKMNEGFEWQLQLYEKMGCKVDVNSIIYKQYRLENIAENCLETEGLLGHLFAIDPNTVHQIPNHDILYRCRKCRRLLFRNSSILPHDEGKGPAAFAHKKVSEPGPLGRAGQTNCTSYFIEPVQWMEAALLGVLEGQLLCPKCASKLGSFHWHGEQCSCGHWVTPAFQIHKNRVDEVKRLPTGEPQNRDTWM